MTTTRHHALYHCATCDTVDDVEHVGREANRLTASDRAAIDERLRETLARIAAGNGGRYAPTWADVETFARVMAHSIGCSHYDLRVCEIDEIRGRASRTVGRSYDHAGRITS